MRTVIRRIGNSLGVVVPRETLTSWGLGEGDYLEIDPDAMRPVLSRNAQMRLDEVKLELSIRVLSQFATQEIRSQSLENLRRWEARGVWGPSYAEWRALMKSGDDSALVTTMIGRDDRANRLRQSLPYVGMLSRDEVQALHEKARPGLLKAKPVRKDAPIRRLSEFDAASLLKK